LVITKKYKLNQFIMERLITLNKHYFNYSVELLQKLSKVFKNNLNHNIVNEIDSQIEINPINNPKVLMSLNLYAKNIPLTPSFHDPEFFNVASSRKV